MDWDVRLEGGPADGDAAVCETQPPEALWVGWCDGHREWHWFTRGYGGTERYRRAELDAEGLTARYVWDQMFEWAPDNADFELVTA